MTPSKGPKPTKTSSTKKDNASRTEKIKQRLVAGTNFLEKNPDIESVDLLISDINGMMRGKWAPAEAIKKINDPGINLPMSLFGLDVWGREVEATGLHIDTGDLDGFCYAIDGRISRAPWAKRPTAQVLMTMHDEKGKLGMDSWCRWIACVAHVRSIHSP